MPTPLTGRVRMRRWLGIGAGALVLAQLLVAGPWAAAGSSSPQVVYRPHCLTVVRGGGVAPDDPLAVPPGMNVPGPIPALPDPVRTIALQRYQDISDVVDFASYRESIACKLGLFAVNEGRFSARHDNLVVLNEYSGLEVFATGERGAAVRQFAATPAGRGALDQQGVPTAAAAGLAMTGAAYGSALAYYNLPPPSSPKYSVHDLFLAATDTFVRGFVMTLRDASAYFSAVSGGPVFIVGTAPMVSRWHAELASKTDANTFLRDCLALYADPSQCHTNPPDRLYIADESNVYNIAFVVGPHPADPDHPYIGVQRKVNLVTLEGPSFLDLTPGTMADTAPIALPGTAVKLGIGISLDAFEHGAPCRLSDPSTFMACLDTEGANVMIQPEANDSLKPASSWADYIDTSNGTANPQWQPLTWMDSAWRAVADPKLHYRYAVNSFMVGNLLDISFDGQSAILSRYGTHCGQYAGDQNFQGPYPAMGPDLTQWAADAGPKPQFLALAPWVLPDADRSILQARARAMAPGSGSEWENGYLETAVSADMYMNGPKTPPGPCAARAPQALTANGPFLRDSSGRAVILRGVNAVYKKPPYTLTSRPGQPNSLTDQDAAMMASLGYNMVRLGVIWKGMEPGTLKANDPSICTTGTASDPGQFDQKVFAAYMAQVDAVVKVLGARGIRTLIDLHQDVMNELFAGEGAPDWAVCTNGIPPSNTGNWQANYATPAVGAAYRHFWMNDVRGDLQGEYDRMLARVAAHFRGNPNVIGYDLYNEPFTTEVFTVGGAAAFDPVLECAYTGTANPGNMGYTGAPLPCSPLNPVAGMIPSVEGADPGHLVFVEPDITSDYGPPSWIGAMPYDNLVFNFHNYCFVGGLEGSSDTPECATTEKLVFDNKVRERAANATVHQPLGPGWFMSEFGSTDSVNDTTRVVTLADQYMAGWAYWAWKLYDDPTGGGNEGLVGPDGRFKSKVSLLGRAYAQAVAGTPTAMSFDPATGAFHLSYSVDHPIAAATLIALPAFQYQAGYCVLANGAAVTSKPGAALLMLANNPRVTAVTIDVIRCRA